MKDDREIIDAARRGFDGRLHGEEYARVHSDEEQLAGLLGLLGARDGWSCLDLGTGSGYVAFELAARSPCAHVVGLDIAGLSIERDTEIARERGLANLEFRSYDGLSLPFAEGAFDAGISRYALHHFPDLRLTLGELRRVITPEGVFVLSDPRTLDEDSSGFADEFQALRGDGHVHYYRRSEIEALFGEFGFAAELEIPQFGPLPPSDGPSLSAAPRLRRPPAPRALLRRDRGRPRLFPGRGDEHPIPPESLREGRSAADQRFISARPRRP